MVHIFCHRQFAYPFETEGDENWMGRHFFTGGIMPSDDLLLHFQQDLALRTTGACRAPTTRGHWRPGCRRMHAAVSFRPLFAADRGEAEGSIHFQRWRMFFMAQCGALRLPRRERMVCLPLPVCGIAGSRGSSLTVIARMKECQRCCTT